MTLGRYYHKEDGKRIYLILLYWIKKWILSALVCLMTPGFSLDDLGLEQIHSTHALISVHALNNLNVVCAYRLKRSWPSLEFEWGVSNWWGPRLYLILSAPSFICSGVFMLFLLLFKRLLFIYIVELTDWSQTDQTASQQTDRCIWGQPWVMLTSSSLYWVR